MVIEKCNCDQSLFLANKLSSLNDFLFEKIVGLELELETSDLDLPGKIELRKTVIRTMEVMRELQRVVSI